MFQIFRPQESISENELGRAMRLFVLDGMFAHSMAVLTTGALLVAYALHLGASNTVIGMLAAIMPVSQLMQIPTIYMVEQSRHRKRLVVSTAAVSRLAWVIIPLLPFFLPEGFRIPVMLGLLLIHFALGAVASCAWNSWMRDLIPTERLPAYYGRRLSWATFVGAVLSLCAGILVDYFDSLDENVYLAFAIVFMFGAAGGLLSVLTLLGMPEPRMPATQPTPFWRALSEPFADGNFRRLLMFVGAWNFTMNFVGPFFAVYLITQLGFNMTWVLGLTVLSQLVNVVFFRIWAKVSTRFGNKIVLSLCVPIFTLALLIWPFTTLPQAYLLTVPLLIAFHMLAGMATAGANLCGGNLTLKLAPYGRATAYLAVSALVSGTCAMVAPLIAGVAADAFGPFALHLQLSWIDTADRSALWDVPAVDIRGLDFLFLIGFVLGLYAIHRLLAVRELGEVKEDLVREEFIAEMRRMVRQVSTVEGIRQLTALPVAAARERVQRRQEQRQTSPDDNAS